MARVAVAYVEIRPDLGGFAEKLNAELAAMKDTISVKVEADTKSFFTELQAAMAVARREAEKIRVVPDTRGFARALREKLDEMRITKRIPIEPVTTGFYTELRTKVEAVRETKLRVPVTPNMRFFRTDLKLKAEAMRPIPIPVVPDIKQFRTLLREAFRRALEQEGRRAGKSFTDAFNQAAAVGVRAGGMSRVVAIVAAVAVAAAPLAGVLSAAAAGATALAVALGEGVVGAAGGLAVSLTGLIQSVIGLKVAFGGLSEAMKAQSDIQRTLLNGQKISQAQFDAYSKALNNLAPNARSAAVSFGVLSDQFRQIRRNVSQAFFAGMAGQLKQLSATYLPMLNSELIRTATMLRAAGARFTSFLNQAGTVKLIRDVMAGNTAVTERWVAALIPLTDLILRLLRALRPLGETLAQYVNDWATARDRSIQAAEASGRLKDIVDALGRGLDRMRSLMGHVFGALGGTFEALLGPGRLMVDMLDRLVTRWDDWTHSIAGQNAIEAWGRDAIPVLSAMGSLIGEIFRSFNRLADAGAPAQALAALQSILPPLTDFLLQLSAAGTVENFATALSSLLQTFTAINVGGALATIATDVARLLDLTLSMVSVVPGLTTALGFLVRMLVLLTSVKLFLFLTGFRLLPGYTVAVINFGRALFGLSIAQQAVGTNAVLFGGGLRTAVSWIRIGITQTVVFIGVLGRAAFALATTRAGALGVAYAMQAIRAAMVANPIGAIITGIALVATAIYAIVRSADSASASLRVMNNELVKAGAAKVGASVQTQLDKLREKVQLLKDQLKDPIMENFHGEEIRADLAKTEAEVNELAGAQFRLSKVYGSSTDQIIAELRKRGVSESTSDAEIVVALNRVHKAYGDQVVTAGQMVNDLAGIYGVWTDNTGAATSTVAGYVNDAAASFSNISQAAVDAATKTVMALAAIADASVPSAALYGGAGRLLGQQQAALNKINAAAGASGPSVGGFRGVDSGFRDLGGKIEKAAAPAAKAAGKKTAAGFLSSLTAELDKLAAEDILGHSKGWINSGLGIAKYIARGITSGKDNILKVGKYIAKKFPGSIKKVQKYFALYQAAATPFVKELGKKMNLDQLNTLLDQIKDFKSKVFEALTPHRDLVGVFGFIPTAAEVRNQLQLQLDTMRGFTKGIEALQAKGLSKDLAAAWLQAGEESAGNLVQGLQNATPEQIAEINKLYNTIGSEATKTSDTQATKFYKVGQATVEGLILGIASQQAAAVKAIDDILDAALAAAKKKLGIKSPSSVFGDMGVMSALGYIRAIEAKTNATVAAVEGMYSQVTQVNPATLTPPTVRPGYAQTGQIPGAQYQQPPVNVRVYLGDKEITDILRVQVDDYDTTRARALLAGRRGG